VESHQTKRDTVGKVRAPVKRERAERYLLLALISFAATVIVTRMLLEATGYPQIGNSQLHIAHVLWGGLLLFVAALLPLALANRWALTVSSVTSGIGVGLFIDEIGKFITQDNDYFYPPAAAIIYAFFLLTVLVYLQVRRPPVRTPRAELYRVFDCLTEVLDGDLDAQELALLEKRVEWIAHQSADANAARLAAELLHFVTLKDLPLVETRPWAMERFLQRARGFGDRLLNHNRLKVVLIVGLAFCGLQTLFTLAILLIIAVTNLDEAVAWLVTAAEVKSTEEGLWFVIRVVLEGSVGLFYLVSAGLLAMHKDRAGTIIGMFSLLISITAVNLLVFYFDQFGAVASTLLQYALLLGVLAYRRRFLGPGNSRPARHPGPTPATFAPGS
jgi:hypothetical protein